MLDITNVCRICLKEEDPKLPIFTENDEKSESKPTLPEKIMSFARVKVVKDDGLPMYICVKCYCLVDTTVEFKRLCEESFRFFTRQLDSYASSKPKTACNLDEKGNTDGFDSNLRSLARSTEDIRSQQSFREAVSFSQHWIIPEESIKVEQYDPEYEPEEVSTTQVFRITGNDESWIDNTESEIDPALVKCEPSWEYPNFDFDLSNVKIENVSEGVCDNEGVNPLELNHEDVQNSNSQYYQELTSTTNIEKTCKCRSCEMVFSNRREMGFHISVAHRRCGTCFKYFFTNKDKDGHICTGAPAEEKSTVSVRAEKGFQCCHLCKKTVKQLKSHMAWHRRRKLKVSQNMKEGGVPVDVEQVIPVDPYDLLNDSGLTEEKVKCRLCNVVCSSEKGFKIHLTCMHNDHRLVYACYICKARHFFNKASCSKHMLNKHGVVANGNLRFELKNVADCEADVKGVLRRRINKKNKLMADKIITNFHPGSLEQLREKLSSRQVEIRSKKFGLRPSHPPFSSLIPIIPNNFTVTLDQNGVKRYVCRGCNVVYKRYISAYNHYYTLSKKAAKAEQNQAISENKPYNCKFCTLKFASRSQAMMHRIHAHKYFYKKLGLEKK